MQIFLTIVYYILNIVLTHLRHSDFVYRLHFRANDIDYPFIHDDQEKLCNAEPARHLHQSEVLASLDQAAHRTRWLQL